MSESLIFVSEETVRRTVRFPDVLAAVERGFKSLDEGRAEIFPVVFSAQADSSEFFAIKSGRDRSLDAYGMKAGGYFPDNVARGIPAHTCITLLLDDKTGSPIGLVEAGYLNGMRTAAAGALAARYLAQPEADTVGVLGAGAQAVFEVEGISCVRRIERVLASGRDPAKVRAFAAAVQTRCGLKVDTAPVEATVKEAQILITATPSTRPLFPRELVHPGLHISAIGADGRGKQEIDPELMRTARVFCDLPEQAMTIGECQHAFRAGILSEDYLRRHTLGALLAGRERGRTSAEEMTLFDSSGIAVQDIAAAYLAVQCAQAECR